MCSQQDIFKLKNKLDSALWETNYYVEPELKLSADWWISQTEKINL